MVALPRLLVGREEGAVIGSVVSSFGVRHTAGILAGEGNGVSEVAYKTAGEWGAVGDKPCYKAPVSLSNCR